MSLRRANGGASSGDEPPMPDEAAVWSERELEILARERHRAETFAEFQGIWASPMAPQILLGTPTAAATPVVICLWNRPQQIRQILEQLDAQDGLGDAGIRLLLWNNAAHDQKYYEQAIRAYVPTGALGSVELFASSANIRGIGRFIAARWLRAQGVSGSFIMLDDDEILGKRVVAELKDAGGPRTIAGFWAWNAALDDYWVRTRADHGGPANYVATGGCVCDLDIVADDSFFRELPELGLFIEDAWMSRYALHRGWLLRGVDVDISFVLHETNQYAPLTWDKVIFWRQLQQLFPVPEIGG